VKPKHKRLSFVVIGMALLTAATILILFALNDSVVFFYSPSDLAEQDVQPDRRFRLGGLVEENSVVRADDGVTTTFRVTDLASTVSVSFRGLLPDLFREGQGVVAEGQLDAKGVFVASEVLAKHDENYMPPEVAEALRKSGQWQGDEGKKQ
jgi:cytochrome c-type biogenesis protein CcmE